MSDDDVPTRGLTTVAGLDAFLELSPDAVVVVGPDGTIRRVNKEAERLFGYGPDDLVGRSIEMLVPDRARAAHQAQRAGYAAVPTPRPMGLGRNLTARRRDGTEVPVDISLAPIDFGDGPMFAAVVRDVSERHSAQRELATWGSLFDRAGFGVIVSDGPTSRIGRVNTSAATMHGYTPDELVGREIADLFVPEERHVVAEMMRKVHAGEGVRIETVHLRADGTTFPVMIDVSAVRDSTGRVTHRVAYVQDITEQVDTAQQLRSWQERFHTSVDAMLDAVVFLAPIREGDRIIDFTITYVNEALTRFSGLRYDELVGARLGEHFPAQREHGLVDTYASVVETGKPATREIDRYQDHGITGAYTFRAAPVQDGLVVVIHDVTARQAAKDRLRDALTALQRTNDRLREANEQLEKANAYQAQFVSMASHELRTPLTTISGFAETLARRWRDLDDPTRETYLETIQRSVQRQALLLSDLLDVSRIRAGRLELDLAPVALAGVVADALAAVPDLVDVVVDVPNDASVVADEVRLVQILVNLFSNAAKYGGAPVVVRASRQDDRIEIAVRDHGPGVPEEFRGDLFEMFAQASRGDRRTAKGTGLGLFIVKSLAEAQCGTVEHRAPADGGAEFVVSLATAP